MAITSKKASSQITHPSMELHAMQRVVQRVVLSVFIKNDKDTRTTSMNVLPVVFIVNFEHTQLNVQSINLVFIFKTLTMYLSAGKLCVETCNWTVWKYINQVPCTMNLFLRNSESFSLSLYNFSDEILVWIIIFLQYIIRSKIFMVYRRWDFSLLNRMFKMESKFY